ncbi:DUF302 domain-containing protein [Humibacter sp. BT305]|nr:DUF302 domain-containing protein [Humibacter sp. BT305]
MTDTSSTPDLMTVTLATSVMNVVDEITRWAPTRRARVFAVIDHGAAARAAGLELQDEVLLVLGNPTIGTTLMRADPAVGLDLPLRVLVFDKDGTTVLAYRDPQQLTRLFELRGAEETVAKLAAFLRDMTGHLQRVVG